MVELSENPKRKVTESISVQNSGYREYLPNHFCIKECVVTPAIEDPGGRDLIEDWYVPGKDLHSAQTAYLITDDKNLLFDTLTPAGEDFILEALDDLLGNGSLDYLIPSHPEANHAGNTWNIVEKYPDVTILAPSKGSDHGIYGYSDDVRLIDYGDTLDLGSHQIEFIEPPFVDLAMTLWMFEYDDNILYTVDYFGCEHHEGECLDFIREMDSDITPDRLRRHMGHVFSWLRYADPVKTDKALDRLIGYDPHYIAPAHGQVFDENVKYYLQLAKNIIRDITDFESPDYHVHTHEAMRYTEDPSKGGLM